METVLALIGVVLGAALRTQRQVRRGHRTATPCDPSGRRRVIGDLIKDQYNDWKKAEQRLIAAARTHIANV
jgi:hypothetical protein